MEAAHSSSGDVNVNTRMTYQQFIFFIFAELGTGQNS
jgi:hypothetical protein